MKMTVSSSAPALSGRLHHRKVLRLAGKRPGTHHHHHHHAHRTAAAANLARTPPTDNSDDSGLGFDQHMDYRQLQYTDRSVWVDEVPDIKRRKLDLKVENEETNDGYCFPDTLKNCKENNTIIRTLPCTPIQNLVRNTNQNVNASKNINRCIPLSSRRQPVSGPVTLTTQLAATSRNGKIQLQIMCQPEQQHRARYQTEGSRGAVKDRTGNGFPIVKLTGYDKPTTLQVFIGTDLGRVAPHMFYQACRVSGKNSTPCIEKKIDGTIVIEVELEPSKDMVATCDCVGILKERNVDVEHRFPEQLSPRSKKKSTKCRMVFRTTITNDDGSTETLQVCSQPIVCTQPPGIPEICKKSLTTSPASGGLELFILGKNFLKDTRVVFQQQSGYDSSERSEVIWEEMVTPDKEYLQQTHLVCVVPPYIRQDILEPVAVRLFVISSGKNSEPHTFHYTPNSVGVSSPAPTVAPTATTTPVTVTGSTGKTCSVPTRQTVSKRSQFGDASKEHIFGKLHSRTGTVFAVVVTGAANFKSCAEAKRLDEARVIQVLTSRVQRGKPPGIQACRPLISLSVRLEANPTSAAPFLSKMLWQTGTPKQEMDLGMMPPPTSLVPLAQRRPSTNLNMESNSPPMRSLKTELIDENSQGSIVMENMINENSMDMRHRFRAISESSLDVHHDEANMTMINENSIEILRQQEIIKNQIDIMNENSNSVASSFHCEKSNASIHNDESVDSTEPRIFSQNSILPPHNLIENTTLNTNDLKGIDLRMKAPLATVNDLVNTQSPSLATLHRFVVSESTNMPLPTQTGQSVENYLTTIENNINKTIVSDSLANSNMKAANEEMMLQNIKTSTLLEGTPILSSQLSTSSISNINQLLPTETPGTNKLFTNEQVISNTLITTSANEILPSLTESHIKNNNNFEQQIINPGPVIFSSQSTNTLLENTQQEVISQQNIQAAINANMLQNTAAVSPKLDVLVNSRIESHIGSPIKSPQQEILIGNKSPLLPSSPQEILRRSPLLVSQNPDILITHTASQDVMMNSQSPLLSSAITTNEIIIHSPQSDISVTAQISPNALSPEVILNPQVSPSVMCRTQPDTLLQVNTICPQNILNTSESTTNNLLGLKNPPVSVESIVINAAVDDYLETQKKINDLTRMDNHLLQNVEQQKSAQEQMINSLLDVRSNTAQEIITNNQAQVLLQNQVTDLLKLSQTQFVPNTNSQDILENNNKADMNLVKQISEQSVPSSQPQPELKKNEEGMIPPALTNMSENDLISYINPSCFDQDTKFQNMDVVPSNKIPPTTETIRRSISTLNISYPNPGLKVRASISFTNGANNFGKQQLNEKTETNAAEDNIKENHVFYIWTKQINTLEPFMVFEEMLTYQGRKYSEADIATLWKKDCRMWLWKTKQRVISKKVNQKFTKIMKKLKHVNIIFNKSREELDVMDILNCFQNLNLK